MTARAAQEINTKEEDGGINGVGAEAIETGPALHRGCSIAGEVPHHVGCTKGDSHLSPLPWRAARDRLQMNPSLKDPKNQRSSCFVCHRVSRGAQRTAAFKDV